MTLLAALVALPLTAVTVLTLKATCAKKKEHVYLLLLVALLLVRLRHQRTHRSLRVPCARDLMHFALGLDLRCVGERAQVCSIGQQEGSIVDSKLRNIFDSKVRKSKLFVKKDLEFSIAQHHRQAFPTPTSSPSRTVQVKSV